MKLRGVLAEAAVLFSAVAAAGGAFAGPVGVTPSFSVDVTAGSSAPLHSTPALTANPDGSYTGRVSGSVANVVSIEFDASLRTDPTISGSFTLTNLSSSTQTFSVAASLSGLLPIAGPTKIGGFFGDATYSDANSDGDVAIASSAFYRAEIDGSGVHDLGNFSIDDTSGPGVFGTISREAFGEPIPHDAGPGVSTSIGVAFPAFSLSAGDSVMVPFEFVVSVPEPAFAPLFAITTAVIFCALAQKRASYRPFRSGRIPPTGG
ncbi:MAG: hypothetical protein ACHQ6T_11655 [Myxococcota bacterium]